MGKSEVIDRDKGWGDLLKRVKVLQGGMSVKVGVLANGKGAGLHQRDSQGRSKPLTIAEIASIMEFGTRDKRIPARSFIRSTFDKMRAELTRDAEKLIAAVVLDGSMSAEKALNVLGLKLASAVKKAVTTGAEIPPPNAPSTARRKQAKGKGTIRTLVDTGRMVGAVSWAVVTGKDPDGSAGGMGNKG